MSSNPSATTVAATPQGDAVIVGTAQGSIDLGTGQLTPGGQNGVFVLELSP
jgi:hypothetical protein